MARKPHAVIIVQNLPVPFDTRVWSEATTLAASGYDVSVICPKNKQHPEKRESLQGVEIYRHPLPIEAFGKLAFLFEYASSLFFEFTKLIQIRWKRRIDVIQICNPPDVLFLATLPFLATGSRLIFDQHDLCPELYEAKFSSRGLGYKVMKLFERMTFFFSRVTIATNESYRSIAIDRGKMDPGSVFVVRSGPRMERLTLPEPLSEERRSEIRAGKKFLVGYVGVIGVQEGLSYLIDAAKIIAKERDDVGFEIVGSGPDLERIRDEAKEAGLEDVIRFHGRLPDRELVETLTACDVCVNADEYNEMNNLSTMNKILEYMALSKPIVQFDMKEGRASAGEASLYAKHNDAEDFAAKILELINDPEECERRGKIGYERVITTFAWPYQAPVLLGAYRAALLGRERKLAIPETLAQ